MWEQVGWIVLTVFITLAATAGWYLRGRDKLRKGIKFVREVLDIPDAILAGTAPDSEEGVKMSATEKQVVKTAWDEAKAALDDLLKKE